MDPERVKALLAQVRSAEVSVDEALSQLVGLPFRDLGYAVVDHHRALRMGVPEVVLGLEKTAAQIVGIVGEIKQSGQNVLVTRVSAEKAREIQASEAALDYNESARTLSLEQQPIQPTRGEPVAVVTAGTSDIPVAEEALETLRLSGVSTQRVYDVGVAGLHRLLARVEELQSASALIVVAGMEGALPSVVGGLVGCPVVAVPTSVGYGASLGGLTALMGMLSSCASGVTVVNIDNGFGAAMAVLRLLRAQRLDGGRE